MFVKFLRLTEKLFEFLMVTLDFDFENAKIRNK